MTTDTISHPVTGPPPSPELSTGWEPEVPAGDTMVRRYLFHNADLTSAIARAAGGEVLESPDVVAADLRRPSGYWNAATLLAPPVDWDATLDGIERFYGTGRGTVVLWSAWPTPDLRARGWEISGHPPLLVRPPTDAVPVADGPDGADPVRVRSARELAEWEQVAVRGYPMPELDGEPAGGVAPAALLDDERFSFWAAMDRTHGGERIASSAMAFSSGGIGSLALGVTPDEHRHRGHWRALCVERLRHMGGEWTAGVFSDFSRPGAERLGFVPIWRCTLWTRPRP